MTRFLEPRSKVFFAESRVAAAVGDGAGAGGQREAVWEDQVPAELPLVDIQAQRLSDTENSGNGIFKL